MHGEHAHRELGKTRNSPGRFVRVALVKLDLVDSLKLLHDVHPSGRHENIPRTHDTNPLFFAPPIFGANFRR